MESRFPTAAARQFREEQHNKEQHKKGNKEKKMMCRRGVQRGEPERFIRGLHPFGNTHTKNEKICSSSRLFDDDA
jgi:hypothetical protein